MSWLGRLNSSSEDFKDHRAFVKGRERKLAVVPVSRYGISTLRNVSIDQGERHLFEDVS